MNWFVHSVITDVDQYDIDSAHDGVCEHVRVGSSVHMFGEQDSFGPVTRFLDCEACYVQRTKAENPHATCTYST